MNDGADTAGAPLIIAVAPNGARKTRADHPALPIGPAELARTAAECREVGASMIHLHVRDREQRHSLDADAYRAAVAAIREEVGTSLIVQMTTEAVGLYRPEEQMDAVRAVKPEAVSLAVRELCAAESDVPGFATFLAWLHEERITPQFIVYSDTDVRRFANLHRQGVVPCERPFLLYVLGRYTEGQKSVPADLIPFLNAADGLDAEWAMCAFGGLEGACALTAAALGGHVRVGFENNLLLADGSTAPDNAALVRQTADAAGLAGRSIADAATARQILGRSA